MRKGEEQQQQKAKDDEFNEEIFLSLKMWKALISQFTTSFVIIKSNNFVEKSSLSSTFYLLAFFNVGNYFFSIKDNKNKIE